MKGIVFNLGKILGIIIGYIVKPNVTFVIHSFSIGGAEKVYLQIVELLKTDKNNKIIVFAVNSNGKEDLRPSFESVSTTFSFRKPNNDLKKSFIIGFISGTLKNKSNKIYSGGTNFLFYEILPYVRKSLKKIEIFHAFNEGSWGFDNERLKHINIIDVTVCISMDAFNKFKILNQKNHNYSNNLYLIRNKIDDFLFEINKKIRVVKNVYFIGRNSSEKRLNYYINIAKDISQSDFNYKYAFHILTDNISKSEVNLPIMIHNFSVNKEIIKAHYENLDILIMTSSIEGHPLVLDEAIASKGIVIAPKVGGIKNVNSSNLYKYELGDEIIIINQIRDVLKKDLTFDKNDLYLNDLLVNQLMFKKSYLEIFS